MTLQIDPGSALCCQVNAHRNGWNGQICKDPAAWDCSQDQGFREDYCESGDDRCYILRAFADDSPGLVIESSSARWFIDERPDALNDQILIVFGPQFHEPRGVRGGKTNNIVFGGYRVKRVVPVQLPYRTNYRVEPYPDSWFRVPNLGVRMPYYRYAGGKYVKQLGRPDVTRVLEELSAKARAVSSDSWVHPDDKARLESFRSRHGAWLDAAAERIERLAPSEDSRHGSDGPIYSTGAVPSSGGLAQLKSVVGDRVVAQSAARAKEPVPLPDPSVTSSGPEPGVRPQLIEAGQAGWIRGEYGAETLQALRTASLSKPFVILRGDPGVGKSHLAVRLLDDPKRERTCIVPVSATWRGREDLLGYVNPISGDFEATEFTRFLAEAERAWAAGDRRAWLVIFEEFNLSQPEHWLADVLAVSQFEDPLDRRIHLGGKGIEGLDGRRSVTLSPGLSFLATVNTDHTTRPLSPRVLDRSAMVSLTLDPRQALRMKRLSLDDEQVRAIETLHVLTRLKGAAFSVRTASSLSTCLENEAALECDSWSVIDLVLSQELLSKIRLLARDPIDEDLMESLNRWSLEEGGRLGRCSLLIEQWKDLLAQGQDVIQA